MNLELSRGVTIQEGELSWRFETSGGPGGQHANRSATRVILEFDVSGSPSLSDQAKQRILASEQSPIVVTIDESRSQWRNRKLARRRLIERLDAALAPPPPERRKTRPSRAARKRRLEDKRKRSEKKRLRRPPDWS